MRSIVINEGESVILDASDPHVRLKLVKCGDVEQNPGPWPQVGCMRMYPCTNNLFLLH